MSSSILFLTLTLFDPTSSASSFIILSPLNSHSDIIQKSSSTGGPNADDDDLKPSQTAGYNPGVAKTLDEYAQLDAEDESLRKWKESLGIVAGAAPAGKPSVSVAFYLPSLSA